MKRSDFLKKLGIGIGVAIVAPRALASILAKEKVDGYNTPIGKDCFGNYGELLYFCNDETEHEVLNANWMVSRYEKGKLIKREWYL